MPAFAADSAASMTELTTDRLLLRQWRDSDREPFAALNADPAVMEHFPALQTREQSDALIDRNIPEIDGRGWGLWALEVRDTGEFIGFTGLSVPSFEAHFMPAVEIGWRLAKGAWGNGYATEAARASLAHGFGPAGLDEIVSFTATTNLPSQRVMQRIGMTHDEAGDFDHVRMSGRPPVAAARALPDQPCAVGDDAVTYAVMDSPLGPLTLVATDAGELAGLYMAEHRHRPAMETFGDRDDSVLPAVAEQLVEYFEHGRTTFDVPLHLVGHAVPAAGLDGAPGHPVRRDHDVRRSRAGRSASCRARRARSGWRTARTRSASSSRATAWSVPPAASPGTAAASNASRRCWTTSEATSSSEESAHSVSTYPAHAGVMIDDDGGAGLWLSGRMARVAGGERAERAVGLADRPPRRARA